MKTLASLLNVPRKLASLLGQDAEKTKHDPSNGQFTSGSGGGIGGTESYDPKKHGVAGGGYTIESERNNGKDQFVVRAPSGEKLPLAHSYKKSAEEYARLHQKHTAGKSAARAGTAEGRAHNMKRAAGEWAASRQPQTIRVNAPFNKYNFRKG